jgi:spermidine/putrescine ABC transporter ATP-binding subunit
LSGIELSGVSKTYDAVHAVHDVSLRVESGEFVTILGPSGSGKTTLLNLIAGLVAPTRGRILIGERDVTSLPAARRNVGLVFQSYALFPHMSVRDNVAFPLSIRGVPKTEIAARVRRALQMVRLDGYENRRPSQLSGGQQQRVALARAFVFEPEILLLDEPLAALDRKLRQDLQVELRQLQRSLGITTVLVTHDQEEALSLSDRLIVLGGGTVQQTGSPQETYLRPNNRFVADFLGTANFVEGVVQPAEDENGEWQMVLDDGEAIPCAAPPDRAPGRRVAWVLRPERIGVGSPEPDRAGLPAEVREAIYLGQSIRYHLRLRNGSEIVALSTERTVAFGPGSPVLVSWDPSDMWLIPTRTDEEMSTAAVAAAE